MSKLSINKRLTHLELLNFKKNNQKITCLTSYDSSFAKLCQLADIDSIIIGDSLGMVVQGAENTLNVTIEQVIYHTSLVAKGCNKPYLIADMPFGSYQVNDELALTNAIKLIQAGAQCVKLESGNKNIIETTNFLSARGINVCGHIGLTPQYINQLGGYKIAGKTEQQQQILLEEACKLQDAGAVIIVLEAMPSDIAQKISTKLTIPTIGIGAGVHCDGQVLVIYDMLGISTNTPKFVKNFLIGQNSILDALIKFAKEVRNGEFPALEYGYSSITNKDININNNTSSLTKSNSNSLANISINKSIDSSHNIKHYDA